MAEASKWARVFDEWLVGDEPNSSGEWRAWCPLCEDPATSATPSASFNFKKGTWHCKSKTSDSGPHTRLKTLSALYEHLKDEGRISNVIELDGRRKKKQRKESGDSGEPKVPLPTEAEVEQWHEALLAEPSRMKYLHDKRGIGRDIVKRMKVGWHDRRGRYTIPVRDTEGVLVNVRMYDPQARESSGKMISWAAGYGEARLFLPKVAKQNQTVVVVEGEMDALCAQSQGLRNVMTHTGGAQTWKNEWGEHFKDKDVVLCYDKDESGASGMRRVVERLRPVARTITIVTLPVTAPNKDITDYFVKTGAGKDDFLRLLDKAQERPEFAAVEGEVLPAPKRVQLEDSQDATYGDHPLELFVQISGKKTPAFIAPSRVYFQCDQSWGNACSFCPMSARGGTHMADIAPHDVRLLNVIDTSKEKADRKMRGFADAPEGCPRIRFDVEEQVSVEELYVVSSVAHRTEKTQAPMQPRQVYNVGRHDTPINGTARIVARNLPSPTDSRGVLLAYESESVHTDLDNFQLTEDQVQALKVFQADEHESPLSKMEEIAEDLAANVTHIYGREALHIAYDAVWHSVLEFDFAGSRVTKGWLELCVVGDTRTGKSEAAFALSRHYNAGVVQSCEGMSFAGLVGGVQQVAGKHWITSWGVVPLNDRRLVVLDEFGGIADKGIIEQMSSIRSSGVAQITKINTDATSARTRLIWIANPLEGKALAEMHQPGISALQTLIKNPEDIARFDLATSSASGDVDPALINSTNRVSIPHVYSQELCSLLVQWAWSRTAKDVVFRPGVENAIIERAIELGARYVPEPPLVQVENVRVKVARIAVAIAARTFSTDKRGRKVVVTMRHVEAALAMMDMLYGMKSFAYAEASRRILRARVRAKEREQEARKYLLMERDSVAATLLLLRNNNGFKIQDFEIFGNMDKSEAQVAVKELTRMGMIRSMSHGKMKIEPPLMDLLQAMEEAEEGVGV